MTFNEWLKLREASTSSACVAMFARPVFSSPVERKWPPFWGEEDPFFKKKKKKVSEGSEVNGLSIFWAKNESEPPTPYSYGSSFIDDPAAQSNPTSPIGWEIPSTATFPQDRAPVGKMPLVTKKQKKCKKT
jgi:hypothetical protein